MSGSTTRPDGITNPPIDDLIEAAGSKYQLVIYAAKRAREINAYYSQLDSGSFENTGPLVMAERTEKPMSIAMREIEEGKLRFEQISPEA
jgi:DNA-directed RNA polymerase subunit omega